MGQAFDRDGNVLGEAYGDTKREVFEKLNQRHADAEAILIRTLRDKMRAGHGMEADDAVQAQPLNSTMEELRRLRQVAVTLASDISSLMQAVERGNVADSAGILSPGRE